MDASEKEKTGIRRFVCDQLRDEPDLSTLTLRILKKRYLERVQCDSLSPEVKHFIKLVVEEALIKMQENDENDSELETKKSQNKRKRKDEVLSGGEDEDESTAKKPRRRSSPSSESEVKKDCKTGSDDSEEEEKVKSESEEKVKSESEDEKKEVKKSQRTTNGNRKPQISSEESSDEEMNESENKGKESSCEDSPQEKAIKKTDATKNGESGSSDASKGKKTPQSDEEDKPDTESESEKSEQMKDNDPSDDSEKEEKVLVEKNDSDSDASSLTSLDEEQNNGKENTPADKKKKATKKVDKKEKSASGPKGDDASVVRLKRYITLCGVRLNYKKVLEDCHSVRSQVAVLKKQLEDLGIDGLPSIKKCRKIKMKREETQELADLDVSNIIATEGRPKRRGTSAWKERQDFPSSTYLRTVNSGSDSDEENKPNRGRKRATDWANLQGIISDDADSN